MEKIYPYKLKWEFQVPGAKKYKIHIPLCAFIVEPKPSYDFVSAWQKLYNPYDTNAGTLHTVSFDWFLSDLEEFLTWSFSKQNSKLRIHSKPDIIKSKLTVCIA